MRAALGFLSLVVAFGLATWVFGWLAVPALAIAFGVVAARTRAPLESLGASLVAWVVMLAVQAARGPADQVARTLGGVIGIPAWAVVLITLVFGAVLAWSGTVLGREVGRASRAARAARGRATPHPDH